MQKRVAPAPCARAGRARAPRSTSSDLLGARGRCRSATTAGSRRSPRGSRRSSPRAACRAAPRRRRGAGGGRVCARKSSSGSGRSWMARTSGSVAACRSLLSYATEHADRRRPQHPASLHDAFAALGEVVTMPVARAHPRARARRRSTSRTIDSKGRRRAARGQPRALRRDRDHRHRPPRHRVARWRAEFAGRRRRARTPTRWCSGSPRRWRACPTSQQRQLGIVGVGNVGGRIERLWRALGREAAAPAAIRRAPGAKAPAALRHARRAPRALRPRHPSCTSDKKWRGRDLSSDRRAPAAPGRLAGQRLPRRSARHQSALAVDDQLLSSTCSKASRRRTRALVAARAIATPHIAGHSLDGKVNGTKMIYDAACAFVGVTPTWSPRESLPPPPGPVVIDRRERRSGRRAPRRRRATIHAPTTRRCARSSSAVTRHRLPPVPRKLSRAARARRTRRADFVAPLVDAIRMLNAYGARVEPLSR